MAVKVGTKNYFPNFLYDVNQGPVTFDRLGDNFLSGNCRLAIQLYFFKVHDLKLEPESVLCPESYKNLGEVVRTGNSFFDVLQEGDLIFAERIRNKEKEPIYRTRDNFSSEEEWITALHTAVFLGQNLNGHSIWHATSINGSTCLWDEKEFCYYYKPVLARRVLVGK